MRRLFRSAARFAAGLALAGCASVGRGPESEAPRPLPARFSGPVAEGAPAWPAADWWAGFGSPELNGLIAAAQADNLDVAAAAARVLQAQAQSRIVGAALFPSLDLDVSAQRASTGRSGAGPRRGVTASAFGISLDAAYQVDLWGRARANLRSADQLVQASRYARQAVALTVTADVAETYLDVLALRQRLAVARRNVEAARRILGVVASRVRHGETSRLDLARQEAQLRNLEAAVPPLQEEEREARQLLALLLGRAPEGFDVAAQSLAGIAAPAVAPGLPSDLLRRRPDVAEAEADLASAHADVEAARAALYPQISLTGSAGFTSSALGRLLSGPSFGWAIGGDLLQTLFDGGERRGRLALSQARRLELVAAYRRALLNAFADVERALGQTASFAEQERAKSAEVAAAAEAFRISELQYRQGVTDLLSVLSAEQALFAAEDQLAQIRLARLQAAVSLYQALGGGWSESPGAGGAAQAE